MERDKAFNGSDDDLTEKIIGVFYEVYNELGYGFLEAVYGRALGIALEQIRLEVASEVLLPVAFRGQLIGSYRADLLVERRILLELKTAEAIIKPHEAQLTHYLRASTIEVGLILNFGNTPRVRRIAFTNDRKQRLAGSTLISPLSF